jgi:DnaJ-class molecular chaperone
MSTHTPETCAFCKGTGKVNTQVLGNLTSCNSCNGTGSVLVAQPARKCASCKGTGRVKTQVLGNETSCNSCNGTGWGNRK